MAYTEFFVTQGSGANDLCGGGPNLGEDDAPIYALVGSGGGTGATATDNNGDSDIEDIEGGGSCRRRLAVLRH